MTLSTQKSETLAKLKREVLLLNGYGPQGGQSADHSLLGPLRNAFPNGVFPVAAVHELFSNGHEKTTAASGFVAGLVTCIQKGGGNIVWVNPSQTIFPAALRRFGIEPHNVVFVKVPNPKHVFWSIEEALKCGGLCAVIGELSELDFTGSRRLQLAVEGSGNTGFLLRQNVRKMQTTASVTRWQIKQLPSSLPDGKPGLGHPRWHVELTKVRNGKPGAWQVEWSHGRLRHLPRLTVLHGEGQRKVV